MPLNIQLYIVKFTHILISNFIIFQSSMNQKIGSYLAFGGKFIK